MTKRKILRAAMTSAGAAAERNIKNVICIRMMKREEEKPCDAMIVPHQEGDIENADGC